MVALVALSGVAACSPKGAAGNSNPDASVAVQSALVTRPATWLNLWGSWPTQRYDHVAAYDSDRSKMVVFGGRQTSNGPYYADTWEWDSTRNAWNERTPASSGQNNTNSPADRSAAVMVYDTTRKKTFLFSGWQPAASYYINDQWEWDGAAATWTQRQVTGTQPAARYGAAMVWDSDRKRAVLFGGFCYDPNTDSGARCNDVWEWDGTAWTNRTPASGTQPSPRMWHSMAYDASRKKIVVYGGYTGTGTATTGTWVDETWEWDGTGTTGVWTKITPTASLQYFSYNIHLAYDASRMKVVAFMEYDYMWEYDPTTPTWTKLATATKTDTDSPPYTEGAWVYDTNKHVMLAFGGYYGSNRDLFEWDGATNTWTNRSKPVSGPVQRNAPAVAYDSATGKLVLFGGYSNTDSIYKQDTWEWSGTDALWNNKTNANAKPTARNSAQLVYDSKRDQFLLWGGSGTGVTNDLWSLTITNGNYNWSMVTVSGNVPPLRSDHQMFYDPKRDKVVLFVNYYTIWEYDPAATAWTQRLSTTTGIPTLLTQRNYYEITYDTDRSKLLLVGGQGYVNNAYVWDSDVWEWDAATGLYNERPPAAGATVPTGREWHVVSYDTGRRVVVLFGGYGTVTNVNAGKSLNDSWEWDGISGAWTETTPPGIKPLERYNHLQVYDSLRATTLVFGGTVGADPTYGPQEIWEYLANTSPRPNGSGCSTATASTCMTGFCVDGVCCAQATCKGTCMACNVVGATTLGTCSPVPAGQGDDSCQTDQACDATQQCKALPGHTCSTFADCASGHCADGVCCDTDCNGACQTCNLASKRGTCGLVPAGNEDPGTCVSDSTSPRFCDASGVCSSTTKAAGAPCTASGQCTSGFCIDGVCCNSACTNTCYACNVPTATGTCYPIPSGGVDHSAVTPCDGAMQYCLSGTCASNKKPNGQACTAATDCGSGFCVDGYCCNSACTGSCQSCGVSGSLGSCVNAPPGAQDTNSTTACMGVEYCDGKGACTSGKKANGAVCAAATECGSGNCVDGVCCNSTCASACYACNLPSSVGTCTSVPPGATDGTACASPNYCTSEPKCTTGKKPNGAACAAPAECGSGNCVDKVCCDSACAGTCQTCGNATGTCGLVAAGMDPRGNCKGTFAACGGTCDGQGACAFAPQGKACRTAGCQPDLGLITKTGMCDGAGNCPADTTTPCNGFGCYTDANGGAQCKTDCSTDPDCAIRRYCEVVSADAGIPDAGASSTCPAQFGLGHACTRDPQCLSGTCAIANGMTVGVCCNTQCSKCGTCDATGTCHPVAAGTDPNKDCQDSASDPSGKCGGMCDGQAHCIYPAAGTTCGQCKSCNGVGLCNLMPEDDTTCPPVDCDELDTSCLDYHDLTTKRCGALGSCKKDNVAATCTDVTNTCGTDGGAGGAGGGGGRGGATGTGGAMAGNGGSTDASTDAGMKKSGGGGCGCDLGGAPPATVFPGLLLVAGIVTARRRRR